MGNDRKYIEVVVNNDWGVFGLSKEALDYLINIGWPHKSSAKTRKHNKDDITIYSCEIPHIGIVQEFGDNDSPLVRSDRRLVDIVRNMGPAANGFSADLKIIRVPAGIQWHIAGNDGIEWVAENHRTWAYKDKPGEYC